MAFAPNRGLVRIDGVERDMGFIFCLGINVCFFHQYRAIHLFPTYPLPIQFIHPHHIHLCLKTLYQLSAQKTSETLRKKE